MINIYKSNKKGVVLNPTIVWKYKPLKTVFWNYWDLKVGKCKNGFWSFCCSFSSGSFPCINGQYLSEKDAVQGGIKWFENHFKCNQHKGMGTDKYYKEAKENFMMFKDTFTSAKTNFNNQYFTGEGIQGTLF